jgi:hypothetical protein
MKQMIIFQNKENLCQVLFNMAAIAESKNRMLLFEWMNCAIPAFLKSKGPFTLTIFAAIFFF